MFFLLRGSRGECSGRIADQGDLDGTALRTGAAHAHRGNDGRQLVGVSQVDQFSARAQRRSRAAGAANCQETPDLRDGKVDQGAGTISAASLDAAAAASVARMYARAWRG